MSGRELAAAALALALPLTSASCRSGEEPLLERPPYLGMWCPLRSPPAGCDRVGLAVRLERPASAVTATVSGEPMPLMPAALGASGHYWYGFVQRSGLDFPPATRQRRAEVTIRVGDRRWDGAVLLREGVTRRGPPAELENGRWRMLPSVPRARNKGYSALDAVRVGRRVVVVAGASHDQRRVEAFAFDPRANRWTRPAAAPLRWRGGAAVVAVPGRAFILGGTSSTVKSQGHGASFDPVSLRWRKLKPVSALERTGHSAIWTGSRVILWGGQARRGWPLSSGTAFEPDRERWRTVASAPLVGRSNHSAIWTGRRMIVWGGQIDGVQDDFATYVSDGAAYDPARGRWKRIAPAPIRSNEYTHAVWTGSRMLVWTGSQGASYDPATDRWRHLPRAPITPRGGLQSAVWAGGRLLVWGGVARGTLGQRDGAAYDPRTRRWSRLPAAPLGGREGHAAAPLGRGMLVWGGCCERSVGPYGDGAVYERP